MGAGGQRAGGGALGAVEGAARGAPQLGEGGGVGVGGGLGVGGGGEVGEDFAELGEGGGGEVLAHEGGAGEEEDREVAQAQTVRGVALLEPEGAGPPAEEES